jgi:hypothetical protein
MQAASYLEASMTSRTMSPMIIKGFNEVLGTLSAGGTVPQM